jgi:hypothetical protein
MKREVSFDYDAKQESIADILKQYHFARMMSEKPNANVQKGKGAKWVSSRCWNIVK